MSSQATLKRAKYWVLGGGLFNFIVALPLGMPFLSDWYIQQFNKMNTLMSLGGTEWLSPVEGANMLWVNTAGLALMLVGITLIYASRNVAARIEVALFNGLVRFVWAIVASYYLVAYDIIGITWIIVAIDLVLAASYLFFYFQVRKLR